MKSMPCQCGGTLKPVRLHNFDLTFYMGLPVSVTKIEGLRCDRCGFETVPGPTIEAAKHLVAALLLQIPERLSAPECRFLRLHLDLTQKELSGRMGISRKTVAEWETGRRISPQHDLILRALVYAHLDAALRPEATVIDHVRPGPPKSRGALIVPRIDKIAA